MMTKRSLNMSEEQYAAHQAKHGRGDRRVEIASVPEVKPRKVIRQSKKKGPNPTELRYTIEVLPARKDMISCQFEAIYLEIANGCMYRTDWLVEVEGGRYEIHEVKGGKAWDDSIVKLKVAARLYPGFTFYIAQYKGGEWVVQKVLP